MSRIRNQADHEGVQRVARELRLRILASGKSQRQVEAELDWGRGYISQLFTGTLDLKVKHVLAILRGTGQPAGDFFATMAREFGGTRPVELTEESIAAMRDEVLSTVRSEVPGLVEAGLEESRRRQGEAGSPGTAARPRRRR